MGSESRRGGLSIRARNRKDLLALQGQRHGRFTTTAHLGEVAQRPVEEIEFTHDGDPRDLGLCEECGEGAATVGMRRESWG